jgi:ankyrin repeat protein
MNIHDDAAHGDLEAVKALLKDNPDLVFSKDNHGQTPLFVAVSSGRKAMAELLLANKADVNAKKTNAVIQRQLTATDGNSADGTMAVAFLPSHDDGWTPLHKAVDMGDKNVAGLLLANKADVNVKDSKGWTPLHGAAEKGFRDMVELLLANKADVNAKTNKGSVPLRFAALYGRKDVAELLRQHGGHE